MKGHGILMSLISSTNPVFWTPKRSTECQSNGLGIEKTRCPKSNFSPTCQMVVASPVLMSVPIPTTSRYRVRIRIEDATLENLVTRSDVQF